MKTIIEIQPRINEAGQWLSSGVIMRQTIIDNSFYLDSIPAGEDINLNGQELAMLAEAALSVEAGHHV